MRNIMVLTRYIMKCCHIRLTREKCVILDRDRHHSHLPSLGLLLVHHLGQLLNLAILQLQTRPGRQSFLIENLTSSVAISTNLLLPIELTKTACKVITSTGRLTFLANVTIKVNDDLNHLYIGYG